MTMTDEKSLDEQMYNVNAWISAMYVTGIKKPTQEDMIHLNGIIANWIKQYREEKKNDNNQKGDKKMKVQIEEKELTRLKIYRDEYRKVMDFLDRKYPNIYNRICNQMIEEVKNDLKELKQNIH